MMTFDALEKKKLLKTLWKKEKMLVTSISSFSPMFSTQLNKNMFSYMNYNLSSASALTLDKAKQFCHLVKS